MNQEEIFKTLRHQHRDLPGSFQPGILPLVPKELLRKNCMVEQQRSQVSEMHFDKFIILRHFSVGKRASRPRYVLVLTSPRMPCCGSKKWRWWNQWTMLRRPSQLIAGRRFPNFEIFDAKIASVLKNHHEHPTSRRKSVWRSKRPIWKTDFSVEDRLRS